MPALLPLPPLSSVSTPAHPQPPICTVRASASASASAHRPSGSTSAPPHLRIIECAEHVVRVAGDISNKQAKSHISSRDRSPCSSRRRRYSAGWGDPWDTTKTNKKTLGKECRKMEGRYGGYCFGRSFYHESQGSTETRIHKTHDFNIPQVDSELRQGRHSGRQSRTDKHWLNWLGLLKTEQLS